MEGNTESGVQAPAAGGQSQQQSQQSGQAAQPAGQDVTVPLTVVQSVRQELQAQKEANQKLQSQVQQFTLSQQMGGIMPTDPQGRPFQQAAPVQGPAPQVAVSDPFEGMKDEELVEVKHLRGMINSIKGSGQNSQAIQEAIAPLNAMVAKLQLQVQDPQYEATIKTHLPEMLNTNPMWAEMIRRAPNPLMAAHAIAKMAPSYIQSQQQQPAGAGGQQPQKPPDILADLGKIIENATRPGNPGQMGGGAGAVSGYERFRNMPDDEFDREVSRVLSGAPR